MSAIRPSNGEPAPRRFRLDRHDNVMAGVCGGIANYFNIDPVIVRGIFVLGALLGFGSFILVYLVIWLLAK